jgi:type I restriction enzyme, S subunit
MSSPNWPRIKLKYLVALKSGDAIDGKGIKDEGDYPVYGGNGLRGYTSDYTHEGDRILIGRQGALCGNINYASGKFWATEHAIVATPKLDFNTTWLGEALRAMNLNQYAQSAAQPGIAVEVIENLEVMVPPRPEQDRIAGRLSVSLSNLDSLVGAKQALLDLLTEKRRALIAHAVTRGLNPNTPLRDSGIEWLAQIPAHWRLLPLRRLILALDQGWSPVASNLPAADGEHGVLKLSAVKNGVFLPEENKALLPSDDIPPGLGIKAGDVFLTRANTPSLVGDAAIAEEDHSNLVFSDLIYRLRTHPDLIDPRWLVLALISDLGRRQIEAEAKGSSGSMVKLAQDQVLGLLLPVPPIDEQHTIVLQINDAIQKLRQLSHATRTTVELLTERRTSIIAKMVIGEELNS